MHFVASTPYSHQSLQLPFVGRTAERQMFSQQVLMLDEPAVHLIGVWGPPGIGTSALLAKFREDAHASSGQPLCLTALADGREGSPLQVMCAYAAQLRAVGAPLVAFEELLDHLITAAWHPASVEQQAAQTLFVRRVQELAHAHPFRGVPLIGGIYEAEGRTTRSTVLQQHPALQIHDEQDFQQWQTALTQAFLDDLNWLASKPVQPASRRGQRIILFLDEITGTSSKLLTWLLAQVLPALISSQVVLVLAGSAPLGRLLPTDPRVTVLPLLPLTEDETGAFLAAYGITDPTRVAHLWQKTGGLPLTLRLLAAIPPAQADGEEDAITTGVRVMEQQEPGYQYLVRYAALFSRPFFHGDLAACPMLSAPERIGWSRRLLALPFVRHDPLTGGHAYHPLVQQHISQRFAREAHTAYRQARLALVRHYHHQLERLKEQRGEQIVREEVGQRLVLALLEQWFWLADETSLRQAVEHVLLLVEQTRDHGPLTSLLNSFRRASPEGSVPSESIPIAERLLTYSEAELSNPAALDALTELLAFVGPSAGFPASLQARLCGRRAAAYLLQEQPRQALEDSSRAVTLDPTYADGYLLRGITFAALKRNGEALADLDRVISLDARSVFAYGHRSLVHFVQKAYERAVENANRVLVLVPDQPEAIRLRGMVYEQMDETRRGRSTVDDQLASDPADADAAIMQGMAHCLLGQHDQALHSFAQAQALDPTNPRIFAGRGHASLEQGDLEQAQVDLARSWELEPYDGTTGLLLAWVRLCRGEPDTEISAWLETLATRIEEQDMARICHSIALLLHQQFEEALVMLEQVLQVYPDRREAAFWKGFACVFLHRDEEALQALEQARSAAIPLPAVLFTPLRRIATVRPTFYQQHLLPLFQVAELRSPVS